MTASADTAGEYELTRLLLDNALEKCQAAGAGQSKQFWATRILQLRRDLDAFIPRQTDPDTSGLSEASEVDCAGR